MNKVNFGLETRVGRNTWMSKHIFDTTDENQEDIC